MNEIEGIKDFIENNKESLENMNKEMIARCGQVSLVWLTVDEAKRALGCIQMSRAVADDIEGKDKELQIKLQERIEQTSGETKMKVTEEMVLLTIQKRHEWLKEYVNSNFNDFIFISSVEKYLNRIKPLVDEMYSLLEEYKKEHTDKK